VLSSDILDDEAYERTAYYQEWVKPQGLHDLQGSTILRDRKRIVSFATFGAMGTRFDASTLARMQSLVPHLARAFRVRTALQEVAELRALAHTKPSPEPGGQGSSPGLATQLPDDERFAALPPSLQPVAQALVAGLSDKEIADTLGMSLSTTRTYVTRTLRKLGLKSRRELLLRVPG
jgi:DNA-binding NarL/FixJ family response regulator